MTTALQSNLPGLLSSLQDYMDLPVERNRTLEPAHYYDPDFYRLEIERIWKREWICAGHIAQLQQPGDYFSFQILDEPIMIVRGHDMKIRALTSVCRHRFMPVVTEGSRGNKQSFQCPSHRWTYGTDGAFQKALYMEGNQDFDPEKCRLPEFRCEIWHGLIFVNLDDDAAPLAPRLTGLEAQFAPYGDMADWSFTAHGYQIWNANWKCSHENNLESYHHMGVHVASIESYAPTRDVRPCRYGDAWTYHQSPWDQSRDITRRMLRGLDGSPQQDEPSLDIVTIFPCNATVMMPNSFNWVTLWPIDADNTQVVAGLLQAPHLKDRNSQFGLEQFLEEDSAPMRHIGRAIRSSKLEAGRTTWLEEQLLRFYQYIGRHVLDGPS